jgi:hypothetical protein
VERASNHGNRSRHERSPIRRDGVGEPTTDFSRPATTSSPTIATTSGGSMPRHCVLVLLVASLLALPARAEDIALTVHGVMRLAGSLADCQSLRFGDRGKLVAAIHIVPPRCSRRPSAITTTPAPRTLPHAAHPTRSTRAFFQGAATSASRRERTPAAEGGRTRRTIRRAIPARNRRPEAPGRPWR